MTAPFLPLGARIQLARRRSCVAMVEFYELIPVTRTAAVAMAAATFGVSSRTVWNWIDLKEER